ncbi:ABC transporter substrate-binding protein [Paenibacillus nasutitermitis]|uniref:ABC transporter substrate-binding protein n=1 Tax=Paenibacillus nasutitermitis TaxID=1652958 RepID=A0A917DZZ8_9BACL|nr:ABC transporter substrate-binding protein [Paenibacillus nasutitermitis]GGD83563.1 ABC transporter substrate-binding protein [Paenibacillus nasutitermitis]
MNKYSCYFVGLVLLLVVQLTGCTNQNSDAPDSRDQSPVNLIYYTIGDPDKDLHLVNDKVNELLLQKIGITITYIKIGWEEYENRLNTMISSDTSFDIAFAPNFITNARRGAWLKLNDYLTNQGKEMVDAIDPVFWEGAKLNDGSIYGIPTNKELAVLENWIYPEALINKYNIDISKYNTLESLEPLLQTIQKNEPDYIPMELNKDSHDFFAMYGYEYLTNNKIPLMIQSLDPASSVVNIFETAEAKQILQTLRHYYQLGFINQDAALREPGALRRDSKVFWKSASGGPLSESIWSKDLGYKVVANPVTPEVATNVSVLGGMMAVNAKTKHPNECIAFLNLLNTDPELRNLFNYGIEGVHYNLDHKGQVVLIPPKDAQGNRITNEAPKYTGVQYTQGNWFILRTLGGDFPDPPDKWEQFRTYNAKVVKSKVLGFNPDLSMMNEEFEKIEKVWHKYYPLLMTGSVDIDTFLPKFNDELHKAGLEKVRAEVQKHLDAWRQEHNKS